MGFVEQNQNGISERDLTFFQQVKPLIEGDSFYMLNPVSNSFDLK